MTPTKFLIGQIAIVFAVVVTTLWFATEWCAWQLWFQPRLGPSWFELMSWPIYYPWRLFEWWYSYDAYAPHLFNHAGAIAASGGFAGIGVAVIGSLWRARQSKPVTTYGSSRWANDREIARAGLFRASGVFLGQIDDRYLRHDGPEHVMAFAPTRSGKGVGLVIPTLLSWTQSVVVHDIKGENWQLTAGWRAKFSHCLLFNPTDSRSARYNPLLEVRKGPDEVRDVQNIADILVDPEGALERRSHWEKTSHSLLVGAILHVLYAEEDKTLARVASFLSDPRRSFEHTLRAMMATNHLGTAQKPVVHPVVASAAREVLNKSENERSGVLSTAMSFLGLYRDPTVATTTSACDWRIADLVDASDPVSLYLVIPPSDISRTKPLVRLVLNQIGRRLTERLEGDPGKRRQHRLLMMLDEFPALGRLDFFEAELAFMAGYGIRAFLIAQSLNQTEATKALTKLRRQWFNKRKSITALLREVLYNEPVQLLDSDADNKMADADLALQALGGDHVSFGYLTTTVVVFGEDATRADEKIRAVERVVHSTGFTTIRESLNATEAWLGSLPGHVYGNVRQPLVHSLNLAHLMPFSSVWAGAQRDDHLDGPPLFVAETVGSTPFRFALHVGDVGHTLIVGPTGAGKSVLLALMALQFRRYPGAQITLFDKGNSARAAVLAMKGVHHNLGSDGSLAFQPLARIDDLAERSWAAEWLAGLLAHEKVSVTPEIKETIWSALMNLASAPIAERTMTGLSVLLQSNALKSALMPYTLEGPFGRLLDADHDELALRDIQCFETESLMHEAGAIMPVLTYLFHRLEERFDGRPSLLILDEAWVFLDDPLFAARIREWLKTLRKKNVSVVFATQSLADIVDSSIAPAIIESCPQRIFLANDRAIEPQAHDAYERFGLNERQIELIARATPKRHYYLQSRRGNRLFELGLGAIALAFCGASDPASQTLIDQILAEHGPENFAAEFLRARNLDWAASLLTSFTDGETP